MIRLYINVDHVATLRQARKTKEPDPLTAALLAELAGADGITIHLREDRRHIQNYDLIRIRDSIATHLNLEMAPTDEMFDLAFQTKPFQVSLVPEKREEITTEGGLDAVSWEGRLKYTRRQLKKAGILFSLFLDPEVTQMEAAIRLEADSVEINTGRYSELREREQIQRELIKIQKAAEYASARGLRIFAGHGLTNQNVVAIAAIPEIEELNIGHNIIARAIYNGMERAVSDMRLAIERGIQLRNT